MTISSDSVKNEYSTNSQGTDSELPITFTYFDNSEIEVYLKADVNVDSEVKWALTTNYTITGSPGASPKVKLVTDPAEGGRIIIRRKTPYTQLVDYAAGDAFPADSHETALDRVVALAQQLKEILERSLAYPNTYVNATGRSLTLPEPENNAIVKWNTDATAMVNDTDLAVSAYKIMADSAADTHPGYLDDKLLVTDSTGLLKSVTGGAANQNVTISGIDATTSVKGVASFSSTQFSTSSGAVSIKSGAVIDQAKLTGALTADSTTVKDEDDMSSNSNTHLATQQSIKAYVDTQVTAVNDDATTSNKGVASFSDANFSVSSGAVSIKDGGIDNDELAGSITAAKLAGSIPDSKLSTISTADKVDIGALDIDGATEMGADIVDGDKLIIDDGANGTEKSMLASRIPTYVFSKTSGDVSIGSDGTAAIGSGVIVNADVKSDAAIAQSKLALDITNSEVNSSAAIAQSKLNLSITNSEVNASAAIAQSKLALDITNSEVNASAAIAQSKLALDITNSEVNASAAIAQSKLALDITNSEVNASAAIAQSKLNLSITNSEVNASAAIADTKLATISTANKVGIGALDIDGGTAIDALADDDLFIVDDGAGGTNKKMTAAQLKTYTGGGGGGVGSIDTIFTMQAKDESAASAASGDDAVFRGAAASVTSAPTLDTTAGKLINQTKVFKYASGSGSTNDWWLYSESIPQGYQNRNMVLQLQYYMEETSGDNLDQAFRFVARDATNGKVTQLNGAVSSSNTIVLDAFADGDFTVGDRVTFKDTGGAIHFRYITSVTHGSEQLTISGAAVSIADDAYFVSGILTDELDYLPKFKPTTAGQDGAKAYRKQLVIPSNCDTLEYGFHYLGSQTDQFLYYDDIALSANQFLQVSSQGMPEYYHANNSNFWDTSGAASYRFDESTLNPGPGTPALSSSKLITISDGTNKSVNSSRIYAKERIKLSMSILDVVNDDTLYFFDSSEEILLGDRRNTSGRYGSIGIEIILEKNDYIFCGSDNPYNRDGRMNIVATPLVNDVVLLNSQDEIFTDWVSYTPSVISSGNFGNCTNINFKWRRVGGDMEIRGYFTAQSPTAYNGYFGLPSGYSMDAGRLNSTTLRDNLGAWVFNSTGAGVYNDGSGGIFTANLNDLNNVMFTYRSSSSGTDMAIMAANTVGSGDSISLQAKVPIAGWSSTFNPVLSMPLVEYGGDIEEYRAYQFQEGSSVNYRARMSGTLLKNTVSTLGTVTNDSSYGWYFAPNQRVKVNISWSQACSTTAAGLCVVKYPSSFGTPSSVADANSGNSAWDPYRVTGIQDTNGAGYQGNVSSSFIAEAGDYIQLAFENTNWQTSAKSLLQMTVEKVYSNTSLAHIIKPAVLFLTDQKPSGTVGGSASQSGSTWYPRTLNTVSGESWFLNSLSSNTFQLQPGHYTIFAQAHFMNTNHTKIKLYDTSNSKDIIIGMANYISAAAGTGPMASLNGSFVITANTNFQLMYRVSNTNATNDLGQNDSYGVNEIYANVRIEKLK